MLSIGLLLVAAGLSQVASKSSSAVFEGCGDEKRALLVVKNGLAEWEKYRKAADKKAVFLASTADLADYEDNVRAIGKKDGSHALMWKLEKKDLKSARKHRKSSHKLKKDIKALEKTFKQATNKSLKAVVVPKKTSSRIIKALRKRGIAVIKKFEHNVKSKSRAKKLIKRIKKAKKDDGEEKRVSGLIMYRASSKGKSSVKKLKELRRALKHVANAKKCYKEEKKRLKVLEKAAKNEKPRNDESGDEDEDDDLSTDQFNFLNKMREKSNHDGSSMKRTSKSMMGETATQPMTGKMFTQPMTGNMATSHYATFSSLDEGKQDDYEEEEEEDYEGGGTDHEKELRFNTNGNDLQQSVFGTMNSPLSLPDDERRDENGQQNMQQRPLQDEDISILLGNPNAGSNTGVPIGVVPGNQQQHIAPEPEEDDVDESNEGGDDDVDKSNAGGEGEDDVDKSNAGGEGEDDVDKSNEGGEGGEDEDDEDEDDEDDENEDDEEEEEEEEEEVNEDDEEGEGEDGGNPNQDSDTVNHETGDLLGLD